MEHFTAIIICATLNKENAMHVKFAVGDPYRSLAIYPQYGLAAKLDVARIAVVTGSLILRQIT